MSDPVIWYKSRAFIALAQTSVLLALGWVLNSLSTNIWDWRAGLVIPLVSNLVIGLKDMWSPTVQAPFAFMNQNNLKS